MTQIGTQASLETNVFAWPSRKCLLPHTSTSRPLQAPVIHPISEAPLSLHPSFGFLERRAMNNATTRLPRRMSSRRVRRLRACTPLWYRLQSRRRLSVQSRLYAWQRQCSWFPCLFGRVACTGPQCVRDGGDVWSGRYGCGSKVGHRKLLNVGKVGAEGGSQIAHTA